VKTAGRWIALAAIVVVAAYLRFEALGEPSYWLDEILHQHLTTRAAAQPWWRWATALHDEHGSLYYLTQLATRLFGTSEAAGRSAAAFFGVATIPLMWFASRSTRAAAVLLAVSPLHVYYSREARGYALLMFLTAALVAVMLKARSLTLLCVTLAAMLYTAAVAAPIVGSALLVAVLCALRTRERWYWQAAAASAVTLVLFRVVYAANPVEDVTWPGFPGLSADLFDLLLRTFTVSALGNSIGGRVAVAMLILAIVGAVATARRNVTDAIVLTGMTVVPLVAAIASLRVFDHFFAVRYVTPALIGFVLLAAAGISAIVRWEAAAFLAATVIASQTWAAARNDSFQKLDWRQIARTIWTYAKPGEIIIAAEPWSEVSLRYYLDQLPPRAGLVGISSRIVADGQRRLRPGVWLVTAGFNPNAEARVWMCGYPLVLGSTLEDFRLHYASAYVEANATWLYSDGWADAEPKFRWATAKRSTITIPRWSAYDEVIRMRVLPSAPGQTMRVSLNGHLIDEVTLPHEWTDLTLNAPASAWINGENTLAFDFAFVRVPGGSDHRTLAVAFESIRIGGPFSRLPALIDAKTSWRNSKTNFPAATLDRDGVVPLIARLGFHPQTVWPLLESGEVRLENLAETAAWGPDCQSDREFLKKAFAALLNRAPAPHEEKELLALPRQRIPGRMVKWPEFRDVVVKR
jgi:hypothetical protein